ncbi:MAG: hypothetical protein ACRDWA_05160 [Acidimicrobiia bacterium]
MGLWIALTVIGAVIYFGTSALAASNYSRTGRGRAGAPPEPGTGDVSPSASGLALLGGLIAVIGIIGIVISALS